MVALFGHFSMAALNIGRGRENSWSHDQSKSATERLLTKMVKQGKLPQSALDAWNGPATDSVPTTLVNSRPSAEVIYQYTKGRIPGVCGCSLAACGSWPGLVEHCR